MGSGGEKVVNGPGIRLGTCGKEVGRPVGAGGEQEQEVSRIGVQEQKVGKRICLAIYENRLGIRQRLCVFSSIVHCYSPVRCSARVQRRV